MSSLTSLLQLSLPKPSSISSTDSDTGGAVLALALHALAINDGFNVAKKSAEQNMSSHSSSYVPAKGWDTAFEDQFIFMLSKNGCANHFTLHCSLQSRSGRMFVHASEDGRPQNVQVLGLQLENYVTQDLAVLRGKKWEGVMKNEGVLQSYFSEHISQPLLALAQKVSLCSPFPANTIPSTPTNAMSELTANRSSSSPRAAGGGSSSPKMGSSGSRQPLSWLSCAAAAAGKMQAREMALAAALGTGTMGVVLLLMYQKSRSVVHGAGRQMVAA